MLIVPEVTPSISDGITQPRSGSTKQDGPWRLPGLMDGDHARAIDRRDRARAPADDRGARQMHAQHACLARSPVPGYLGESSIRRGDQSRMALAVGTTTPNRSEIPARLAP